MTHQVPLEGWSRRAARTARATGCLAAALALYPLFVAGSLAIERDAQGPGWPGPGPGGGGRGMGGVQPDREVVAQFDRNGDKRLDAAERKAAREWLSSQPAFGPAGRGGRFGDPPAPGRKLSPRDVKAHPGSPVYDPATLRTLFLQFEEADWEQELAAFNNTDVEVPASLTVDGRVIKTNAPYVSGSKITLLQFDFDKVNATEGALQKLQQITDPKLLKDIPGVRMVTDPVVTIEFGR